MYACVEDKLSVSKMCALMKRKCHWDGYRDVKYQNELCPTSSSAYAPLGVKNVHIS